jgi:hypothetical protein
MTQVSGETGHRLCALCSDGRQMIQNIAIRSFLRCALMPNSDAT